jgi:hypothetical protein
MKTIHKQIHDNAVALISLFIAVSSLGYNTWRNEKTEEQRNVRHAAFRVLENLGELQQVIDYRHYYLPFRGDAEREGASRLEGFGNAAMIRDLMGLMPDPAPEAGQNLQDLWEKEFLDLGVLSSATTYTPDATDSEHRLTVSIREARTAVLDVLEELE